MARLDLLTAKMLTKLISSRALTVNVLPVPKCHISRAIISPKFHGIKILPNESARSIRILDEGDG
jgi:hypothetical protein